MIAPKKTAAKKKAAPKKTEEIQTDEVLTPEWQDDFLVNLRMGKTRIPPRFEAKSFENFAAGRNRDRKNVLQAAKAYVSSFKLNNGHEQQGLNISGSVGAGKTHIAIAILRGVVQKGYSGLYYNMVDLLKDIRATYNNDSNLTEDALLEKIHQPDLLVLDDLGAEKTTEWVNDRLYLIINRRYEACKPVVVTTNLDLAELSQKVGNRTVSRLCEICHNFPEFPNEDFRRKNMR